MTPVATRLARTLLGLTLTVLGLTLTVLGLGLPTAPRLLAFDSPASFWAGADGTDCPTAACPAGSLAPAVLVPAYALTLQGRTRSLQELFGRPQW